MTIIKFTIPSEKEILNDIPSTESTIDFIGGGSVFQTLKETKYVRLIKFQGNDLIKKVIYKKKGMFWGFESIEDVAS